MQADDQQYKIGEHAFDSCFNLQIVEPNGYRNNTNVSFGECCFKNCRSLKSFLLPQALSIRVNAFDGCPDGTRVHMLQQISDPTYQQTIYFPILTNKNIATKSATKTKIIYRRPPKSRYRKKKLTEEPVFRL